MNEPQERPKIAQEPISVLLPAFNQAAGLEPIANAWLRELRRIGRVYRLIVRIVLGIHREPLAGWRGWAEWRRAVWLRLLFGLRLADVPCAFKLFRRAVFDRLPIQSDGQFVHAEMMAKANFLGCLIGEVPIGRLGGNFRGVAEPEPPGASFAAEARRVFRHPPVTRPPVESAGG